jgi:hypothetical protein
MQILQSNDESPICPEPFYYLLEANVEPACNAESMPRQIRSVVEAQNFRTSY